MADVIVKPAFQSAYPDSGDTTKFGPNAWNAARLFSAGALGDLLYRDTGSATGASWLADVAIGSVLVSGGVSAAPAWAWNVGLRTAPNVLAANSASTVLSIAGTGATSIRNGRIELINPKTPAAAGDEAGRIVFVNTFNGTGSLGDMQSGQILSMLDGSGGTNGFGGSISIWTKNDNASTTSERVRYGSNGDIVIIAAAAALRWNARTRLSAPANGQFNLTNDAITAGVGLDVATDAILKVRTTAQSADAKVSALAFRTMTALVTLGGGATPTFGTIGGSGPTAAAQNTWLRMEDSTGAAFWVPVWK